VLDEFNHLVDIRLPVRPKPIVHCMLHHLRPPMLLS
jgi:hypothetical protein